MLTKVGDQEDNLWIATNGDGVYCVSYSPFRNYDQVQGLSNSFVNNFAQDSAGKIYIGTDNGLFLFKDNRFYFQDLSARNIAYRVNVQEVDQAGNVLVNIRPDSQMVSFTLFRGCAFVRWTSKLAL